jgi:hypothetical protein
MISKLEAALIYASWGWRVLPVVPNGKLPATQHGVHDATTTPEQISRWWTNNPDFNIGIAAGEGSGIAVFDIDPRNGGDESWDEWVKTNGNPPDCAMQLTAGGGQHYIAHWNESLRSCKLADGIDLLSTGRYFVAYPSSIEGRVYEWEGSSDPFDGVGPFEIPIRWKIAIDAKKRTQREAKGISSGGLIQGNRNDGLTSLAGAMRHFGMAEPEILAAISIANETRCEIPLPSSEIRQIVHSVCRYEPDTDIAVSMALGSEAAEALLAAATTEKSGEDYYLTRATSFLSQPAPLQWIIKGWLPSNSTTMIFGESGVGKTFVSLSMACAIATGQQWNHNRTASGTVVYLAGEGNYGIRQRVASWARTNDVDNLDNLLISNKSVDMDSPGAAAQILKAIRTLTDGTVTLIVIDTLNNHMSGDENSARDTRAMLNACNIVAAAVQASVMLVHHVGHQSEKVRARGSSAWRAALDTSIAVMRSKDDESLIEVSCTKMKDAADPQPIYGRLQKVDLNWCDEDGEVIYGAVFAIEDAPVAANKVESEYKSEIRKLSNAWWKSGAIERDGAPYVARNDLIKYLVENEGVKEETAKMYVKEGKKGRLVYNLLTAQVITPHDKGWLISDQVLASTLLLSKGNEQ